MLKFIEPFPDIDFNSCAVRLFRIVGEIVIGRSRWAQKCFNRIREVFVKTGQGYRFYLGGIPFIAEIIIVDVGTLQFAVPVHNGEKFKILIIKGSHFPEFRPVHGLSKREAQQVFLIQIPAKVQGGEKVQGVSLDRRFICIFCFFKKIGDLPVLRNMGNIIKVKRVDYLKQLEKYKKDPASFFDQGRTRMMTVHGSGSVSGANTTDMRKRMEDQ